MNEGKEELMRSRACSCNHSEGKSGSFFYLSSDGKYFVKTVHKEEHKLLRHTLFKYYNHMTKTSTPGEGWFSCCALFFVLVLRAEGLTIFKEPVPDSLLTRIVGCHVVRLSRFVDLVGDIFTCGIRYLTSSSHRHSKTGTGAVKIYFVVMENALDCAFEVDRKYDLKGSWVGR